MSLSKLRELVMDRKPGMQQYMGWQRVANNRETELTPLISFVDRVTDLSVSLYTSANFCLINFKVLFLSAYKTVITF